MFQQPPPLPHTQNNSIPDISGTTQYNMYAIEIDALCCCLAAGVFAFSLIFCTFFFIGKLDKTPRKDCCGCTCHTQGKYAGTVFPDTLPQFQTPGFDNPLGPYDAPAPNGAVWNGGGEALVVVNTPNGAHKGKEQYS